MAEFSRGKRAVRLNCNDTSAESLDANTLVLTPETFTRLEWAKLVVCHYAPSLWYDFSFSLGGDADDSLQLMMPALIASATEKSNPVVILGGDSNPKDSVLRKLSSVGLVACLAETPNHSSWRMTEKGKTTMRALSTVIDPISVLKVTEESPNLAAISSSQGRIRILPEKHSEADDSIHTWR